MQPDQKNDSTDIFLFCHRTEIHSFAELPLAKFLPASDLMHLCDIVLVPLIIPCFNNIVLLMFTVHLTGIY